MTPKDRNTDIPVVVRELVRVPVLVELALAELAAALRLHRFEDLHVITYNTGKNVVGRLD
jgi:hypothetical protein